MYWLFLNLILASKLCYGSILVIRIFGNRISVRKSTTKFPLCCIFVSPYCSNPTLLKDISPLRLRSWVQEESLKLCSNTATFSFYIQARCTIWVLLMFFMSIKERWNAINFGFLLRFRFDWRLYRLFGERQEKWKENINHVREVADENNPHVKTIQNFVPRSRRQTVIYTETDFSFFF